MKHKSLQLLLVVSIVMMSLACSVFTRFTRTEPTPTFNYIFTPVLTPLKIEPDSLPNAQTGVEYDVEIRVSDNVTPVNSVSISSGTLPAGLELVFVDGVDGAKISGTPEETGTFTFTVGASCFSTMVVGQTAEKEYVIVVEK
jgi:Putative Ig domain